jgi:hypothetical protein
MSGAQNILPAVFFFMALSIDAPRVPALSRVTLGATDRYASVELKPFRMYSAMNARCFAESPTFPKIAPSG